MWALCKFVAVPATEKQFLDEVNITLISKLSNGIQVFSKSDLDILMESLF